MMEATRAGDPDDSWEYQYHETETETFLVDLDLSRTTRKAPIKPTRKTKAHAKQVMAEADQEASDGEAPTLVSTGTSKLSSTTPRKDPGDLQIMELDSANPVVSYNNKIYDCNWIDMVGTNMFFPVAPTTSQPKSDSLGKYPHLVGTSRIKVLGSRAKVTNAVSRKRKVAPAEDEDWIDEQALPGFTDDGQPSTHLKKQAKFLEKLMDIKKRRGENDLVAVLPAPLKAQQLQPPPPEDLRAEIDALNRRIVKGDVDALSELQPIISRSNSTSDQPISVPGELPVASKQMQSPNPATPRDTQVHNDHG